MKPGDKVCLTRDDAVSAWPEIKAGAVGVVQETFPSILRGSKRVGLRFKEFPADTPSEHARLLAKLVASECVLYVDSDAVKELP